MCRSNFVGYADDHESDGYLERSLGEAGIDDGKILSIQARPGRGHLARQRQSNAQDDTQELTCQIIIRHK